MSPIDIQQPFLVGGIQSTNFFNGRLLSGQDLRNEQAAAQEARMRMGRAIGEGVAYGLQVSAAPGSNPNNPTLTVTPGLAVNRSGHTLALTSQVDVSLVRSSNSSGQGSATAAATPQRGQATSSFGQCRFPPGGTYVAGAGLYLLTIAPAEVPVGSAPVSGLGNVIALCGTDYNLAGVQFRLIPFSMRSGLAPTRSLRNRMAHECFGTTDNRLASLLSDPFSPQTRNYGLMDDLRATGALTPCDVPLAVVYWAATQGLPFVDMWSVRRRITGSEWTERWGPLVGDRRLSEAEAMFLQFEDHIAQMRLNEPDLRAISARTHFDYLPPVGLLPVGGEGTTGGFDLRRFFGGRGSVELGMLNGNALRGLLHEALYYEPIPMNDPTAEQEKIQLYLIWENVRAAEANPNTQLTLVFAAYGIPYRGVARYGYAQRDLSRFARTIR